MTEFFTHPTEQYSQWIFSFPQLRFFPENNRPQLKATVFDKHLVKFTVWHNSISYCTFFIILLSFSLFSSLNAQQFDAPIFFPKKLATIKEVLILPAKFDCFHLTSGGIREYNYDMTNLTRKLILEKVSKILTNHSFTVTTLPDNSYIEKCWVPLRHFYSVVNYQILKNVYGDSPFPNAVSTFSYTLPPIPDSLLYPSTDAVLFIDGFDDCATIKRQKSSSAAAAITAVSVASVVLGGPGVFVSVPSDQTAASCALVDRRGSIIWYYRYRQEGDIDMTERKDVEQFFTTLLHQLRNGDVEE